MNDTAAHAHASGPAPATAAAPAVSSGGISPEQFQEITAARERSKKIRRAAGWAAFSGWTLAVFGGFSILFGLFSLRAFVLGVGLCGAAFVELRGAKGLRDLDLGAPRRLALNQVGIVIVITLYAVWGIVQALTGPGAYDAEIAAGGPVGEMLEPIDQLTRAVTVGVSIALIGGSALAQGLAAAYYLTRRSHIAAFLRSTPKWAVEAVRH